MYCSNCGAKSADGAKFCTKCGQKLEYDRDGRQRSSPESIPKQTEPIKNIAPKSSGGLLAKEGTLSKIGFPVAGISFVLHGILFLYYFVLDYSVVSYHIFGDISHFTWQAGMCFLLFACAVLLFLRKIKPFSIALLVYSIWNIIWYAKLEYRFAFISPFLNRRMILNFFDINLIDIRYIIEGVIAFSYGMLAFLAIVALIKENKCSVIAKKLWYIPGILFCLVIIAALSLMGIVNRFWQLWAMDIICSFAEIMLSGWCLTHSYRKRSIQTKHTDSIAKSIPLHDREHIATELNSGNYSDDAPSFGYAVLGCFIPVTGLILYLVWKEQTPLRAKSAGKGALVGVIVWVGFSVLMAILPLVMLGSY